MHWTDLGNGPVLLSSIGEKGVRDPFIVRNCLDGKSVQYTQGEEEIQFAEEITLEKEMILFYE